MYAKYLIKMVYDIGNKKMIIDAITHPQNIFK
jgi:hypothetical protein